MRPLAIALAGLLCFAGSIAAQTAAPPSADTVVTPARKALAAELLGLMRVEETSTAAIVTGIDQQIRGTPSLAPYRGVMEEWARSLFSSAEARDLFAVLYASTFSEEDLRGLIAFYRTPLGQRVARNGSTLTVRGAEVGRLLAERHQGELTARIRAQMPNP